MLIRKLRLKHGWSQDQLAELSGLSIRTVQRIERGEKPSLESLKSLAAVFEINVSELQQESDMSNDVKVTDEEQIVIDQVRAIKSFYSHLITYLVVIGFLFVLNLFTSSDYIWAWWPALGWGIGVINHGLNAFEVFDLFGAKWEKRQIEKRLGRKL
ncbi:MULTISPECIES: helix-turn-helix domain-containing protein [Vibrio]|uniref:Helix-turn-helix domain-containing protein n=1 Tax=Vibrio mimicus TaxID=674 RepID=A0A2J9VJI9_VIBMI|nr:MULTISPECIES: helix-turn-helix domain-containing protein [Vibrio]EGQ8118622.1 helix-turn-helix domain-containing protein [Vibrio cholerae]EGR0582460.1 helix-turn-helix domain-containing protein [Vibrio cholerae]EGR1094931.1 helix-turn-helix domain-containing protein [Vibrio cholerae]EGR3967621.1 helix-turn-helix domain-containing protein [Vibrio cholerae]ELJ8717873.1 helix-turn-helix domain-containing protein [Vibrio cholerae]